MVGWPENSVPDIPPSCMPRGVESYVPVDNTDAEVSETGGLKAYSVEDPDNEELVAAVSLLRSASRRALVALTCSTSAGSR